MTEDQQQALNDHFINTRNIRLKVQDLDKIYEIMRNTSNGQHGYNAMSDTILTHKNEIVNLKDMVSNLKDAIAERSTENIQHLANLALKEDVIEKLTEAFLMKMKSDRIG